MQRVCSRDGGGPACGHGTRGLVNPRARPASVLLPGSLAGWNFADHASVFWVSVSWRLIQVAGQSLSGLTMLGQTSCPWMGLLSPYKLTICTQIYHLPHPAQRGPDEGNGRHTDTARESWGHVSCACSDGAATASARSSLGAGRSLAGLFRRSV